MNKLIVISLVALSAFSATSAMAQVDLDTYRFECPKASGGTPSERLTNYGSYIRGMGEANLGTNKVLVIFNGKSNSGIPLDLSTGGYSNAGTQYNPSTGRVTCLYTSTLGSAPFNVSYVGSNILHGYIIKASNSAITINVLAGLLPEE
jgi:hypothetical protein